MGCYALKIRCESKPHPEGWESGWDSIYDPDPNDMFIEE
jgi:hypothetical protein